MKMFVKTLAVLCAVLFVVTGVMALLFFNIEHKAFAATTYKQAFENQKLYERMPAVLAVSLQQSLANEAGSNPMKVISQDGWEKTLSSLLPPDEIKALTDDALDSIFNYLNGKTDSAAISLLPFKQHLVGENGVAAAKQILSGQPDCTQEQLMQMGLNLLSGGDLLLCNPPAELIDMFNPMIESQLQVLTVGIPDQITIIKGEQSGTADDPRIGLSRVRLLMKLTPILPLVFLFGLTLLAVRRLVDWLKWWGVPFIVTGAISALTALLGSPLFSALMQRAIQNRSNIPPTVLSFVKEIIGAVSRQILAPVVVEGALLTLVGIAMISVAVYLSNREKLM